MLRNIAKALCSLIIFLSLPSLAPAAATVAESGTVIRIGILSHRPLDEASDYWQPLQTALEEALPGLRFELLLSGFAGLDERVETDQVDLVLTNPNHYIQLRERKPGMRALATTIEEVQGQLLPLFGGVIVTRADRSDLNALSDLVGLRIAAVDSQSLGGYRAQLFEFYHQGLPLPRPARTLFADMPHDQVVEAVLDGQADAGFVRTGIIEQMAAAGKLDLADLRVINPQEITGFPLALSTRLYPQWALAAMPGLPVDQASRITAALLSLDLSSDSTLGGIGLRFTVAAEYRAVEDLAQALRLPPFDQIPRVTVREFVVSHPLISAGIAILIFVLMGGSMLLWFARARIKQTAGALQRLIASVPVGLSEARVGADGGPELVYLSDRAAALIGLDAAGNNVTVTDFVRNLHPDDLDLFIQSNREAIADSAPLDVEVRFQVNDQWRRLRVASNPLRRPDGVLVWSGSIMDVTEQRLAEQRLRDSESRFRILLEDVEGVAVQGYGLDGSVHYWNRAAEQLYGYSREEALGSNLVELIIPEDMRPAVRENLARVARGGRIDNGELELLTKTGRRVMVYSSHVVLRAPGKAPELFCLDIDLSERKRHEQEVLAALYYDGLTGLPNRALLSELMVQACARADRDGSALALCYLDLDQFKPINDAHGTEVGDRVLAKVASRLRRLMRGSDVVARLAGDEFVLLLEGVAEQARLHERLQFLLDGVARPMQIDGKTLQIEASIGVTLYPQDGEDPDVLLRRASQAMFEAKQKGRHRFSLFDSKLEQNLEQRRQMLAEIEHGLAEQQFILYYQPKVDLLTGALIGLEALVRWQHPSRGLVPPLAFLEFLDGTELERAFGEYVITQALAQLAAWNQGGQNWTVSVNIAGAHLLDERFDERLVELLRRYPTVRPEQLELEILESAAVSKIDRAISTLKYCRQLGMRVALDDFGTGYSSLSRLRTLPVDVLKIDQSFVRGMLADLSDYSIVKSVIGLGHAFDLEVIAEGVETTDHAVALLRLGCRQGQGYGIARPMPADAVCGWFEHWQQAALWQQFEKQRLNVTESTLAIAVNTHEAWLARLRQSLRDESAEPMPDAADHDRCALGLWLRDEGRHLYGAQAAYLELIVQHRKVHQLAGALVDTLTAGAQPEPELEQELEQTSAEVKRLLNLLRSRH